MNWTPTHEDEDVKRAAAESMCRVKAIHAKIKENRISGEAALRRLLPIAQRDTGQSKRVALFLLGLYNGYRFPFNLTNLRSLDFEIHEDCMAVLRMDSTPYQEVHQYFENGGEVFEQMAKDWGVKNAERAE